MPLSCALGSWWGPEIVCERWHIFSPLAIWLALWVGRNSEGALFFCTKEIFPLQMCIPFYTKLPQFTTSKADGGHGWALWFSQSGVRGPPQVPENLPALLSSRGKWLFPLSNIQLTFNVNHFTSKTMTKCWTIFLLESVLSALKHFPVKSSLYCCPWVDLEVVKRSFLMTTIHKIQYSLNI